MLFFQLSSNVEVKQSPLVLITPSNVTWLDVMVYDIPAVYVVQSTEDVTSKFQMV